jgi:hypothetical protein
LFEENRPIKNVVNNEPPVDDGKYLSLTALTDSYGNDHFLSFFWLLIGIFYGNVTANDFFI